MRRGTSLICLATEDGVFLAADDLVYAERDGQAIPLQRDFRKVGEINTTLDWNCRADGSCRYQI